MTIEEARKFLADKKVFVKNKGKEVQEKLFNIGFKWVAPEEKGIYKDRYFLFLYEDLTLTYVDVDDIEYFYEHRFKEISAEDILNIKVEHLPKTWEEFCEQNEVRDGECFINSYGDIVGVFVTDCFHGRKNSEINILPNKQAAKQHLALMQLNQLRDCYRGNIDSSMYHYSIIRDLSGNLIIIHDSSRFLSFSTKELAQKFLSNFEDLIEEAGDLI